MVFLSVPACWRAKKHSSHGHGQERSSVQSSIKQWTVISRS